MREHDVERCECGKFVAIKPSIHYIWTMAQTGNVVAMQGDDPGFCPHCNTKFGVDAEGPWREAMVPKAALEWACGELGEIAADGGECIYDTFYGSNLAKLAPPICPARTMEGDYICKECHDANLPFMRNCFSAIYVRAALAAAEEAKPGALPRGADRE